MGKPPFKSAFRIQYFEDLIVHCNLLYQCQIGMGSLPPPASGQIYVSVSPIHGGEITLPERSFVYPHDPMKKRTVPSLSFLIEHPAKPARILFDLGLRSRFQDYIPAQQAHLQDRVPYHLGPGVANILREDSFNPADIDVIILSHVHYDHHGDPVDFPNAQFYIGPGSLHILRHGLGQSASHQTFDKNLFPDMDRVQELPSPSQTAEWQSLGPFKAALDIFRDGSVYIVHSPGHLPGHINLLCRTGENKWVYLGGDSCHDMRLLSGERDIATWTDDHGHTQCIHVDRAQAEDTLLRIRKLQETNTGVEVVMAHDATWWAKNYKRGFPRDFKPVVKY